MKLFWEKGKLLVLTMLTFLAHWSVVLPKLKTGEPAHNGKIVLLCPESIKKCFNTFYVTKFDSQNWLPIFKWIFSPEQKPLPFAPIFFLSYVSFLCFFFPLHHKRVNPFSNTNIFTRMLEYKVSAFQLIVSNQCMLWIFQELSCTFKVYLKFDSF